MARKFGGRTSRPKKAKRAATMIQQSRSMSPAEKASFHQISGAGKRRVKREFFGLTAADETAIVDRVAKALDEAVKEA